MRYAVIIPACNEQECIGQVLGELREHLPAEQFAVAVGVNGSTDRTAEIARVGGALVAETPRRGYGYGCQAAIDLVDRETPELLGYIFVAADGANHPGDIASLVEAFEKTGAMVLGQRTTLRANWKVMGLRYVLANRVLGFAAGILAGRRFVDLGPLRLISKPLFRRMQMEEWSFGWTVEAQVVAGVLGCAIEEVPVRERHRLAGRQKVSRVSWRRTLHVGAAIFAGAIRSYRRVKRMPRNAGAELSVAPPAAPLAPEQVR